MKLLFFAGKINSQLNASNKIVIQVATRIAILGTKCIVLGITDEQESRERISDNLTLITLKHKNTSKAKLDVFLRQFKNRSLGVRMFAVLHPITAIKISLGYRNNTMVQKEEQRENVNILNELIRQGECSHVIAVQEPAWTLSALLGCTGAVKKIVYQLDPYGLHEIYCDKKNRQHELQLLQNIDFMFTTKLLFNQYVADSDYMQFAGKMYAVEFPNVRPINSINNDSIIFDNSYTNIVFCGIIDDKYRSATPFLTMFEKMLTYDSRLRVYFVGDIISNDFADFLHNYPDNIIAVDRVDLAQSTAIQQQADFLLNIGNNITNQVPSKIFDYFSIGRPIISMQCIANDPSMEYLQKYPLCIVPRVGQEQELLNFIHINRGQVIDYWSVADIFKECTTEYVADKMLQLLMNLEDEDGR